MKVERLPAEYDFDFLLFGISSHLKDYRFAWTINQAFNFDLARVDDLILLHEKRPDIKGEFLWYKFEVEVDKLSVNLISNQCEGMWLVPEKKEFNFFLIYQGIYNHLNQDEIIQKLKGLKHVLLASKIDPMSLKSRNNLILE